jgi:hypothetical protein
VERGPKVRKWTCGAENLDARGARSSIKKKIGSVPPTISKDSFSHVHAPCSPLKTFWRCLHTTSISSGCKDSFSLIHTTLPYLLLSSHLQLKARSNGGVCLDDGGWSALSDGVPWYSTKDSMQLGNRIGMVHEEEIPSAKSFFLPTTSSDRLWGSVIEPVRAPAYDHRPSPARPPWWPCPSRLSIDVSVCGGARHGHHRMAASAPASSQSHGHHTAWHHVRCINNLLGASTFLVTCVLHCHRPQNGERPVSSSIALWIVGMLQSLSNASAGAGASTLTIIKFIKGHLN